MVLTKNSKGSPSDPKGYRQKTISNGKGRPKSEDPPSEEIQRLEFLYNAIRTSTGQDRDPKGGCFCQAREHALSPHTPICRTCGLILCIINQPYYACPHCSSLLLTSIVRISTEERLEKMISDTLAKEANERQRAIEEAHRAAGAFPCLPRTLTPPTNASQARSSNQTHKVLSLNGKTKRLTISSYAPTPPESSRSDAPPKVAEEVRVPPPPVEVSYARSKPDPNRPWARMTGGNACYIPTSVP